MGRIGEWAPVGSLFAGFVNTPALAVAKRLAGVAPDRKLPQFAPRTFRAQFKRNGAGDPVVLFDGVHNRTSARKPQRPRTSFLSSRLRGRAAGAPHMLRPAYCDYGMLDAAKWRCLTF